MTKSEFIKAVDDEITASCSIPVSVPSKEIERILGKEVEWLYREYRHAHEDGWYVLDRKYFLTSEFKQTRTIQLPDCVLGIKMLYELTSGHRVFGINDPDLSFDRLMASDLFLTPMSSDQITYRTIQWSFWDLARQFNLRDVQHDFNINTKRLKIIGRDPDQSLWISTLNKIPEEDMYSDPFVLEWIAAKAKIQLSRILGLFNYTLIGGVQINYAAIAEEGRTKITELTEQMKKEDTPDWFLMFP